MEQKAVSHQLTLIFLFLNYSLCYESSQFYLKTKPKTNKVMRATRRMPKTPTANELISIFDKKKKHRFFFKSLVFSFQFFRYCTLTSHSYLKSDSLNIIRNESRWSGLCLHFMFFDQDLFVLGFLICSVWDQVTIFVLLHMSFLAIQETFPKMHFLKYSY